MSSRDILRPLLLALLTALALVPSHASQAYPRPGLTAPASVTSEGLHAIYPPGTYYGHGSISPDVSFDGRSVAFSSVALNLVDGDTNLAADVFVRDLAAGTTTRVSISSEGLQGLGCSASADSQQVVIGTAANPSISSSGRFIAFESSFCNLVIGDTNLVSDVFVHDSKVGGTERVSMAEEGSELEAYSGNPAISPNGRFVLYRYNGDGAGDCCALHLHDRKTDKTTVLVKGENQLTNPGSVTSDGRYVYFETTRQLVTADINTVTDVYLLDNQNGNYELVSLASDENSHQGGTPVTGGSRHRWFNPIGRTMSPDGRYFAFSSDANNFVPNDSNGLSRTGGWDVFIRDRTTGRTERVSVDSYGKESATGFSQPSAITSDGRFIVIWSYQNFDRGDTADYFLGIQGDPDVFVYDRYTGTMDRISVASDGTEARNCPQDVSGNGLTRAPGSSGSLSMPGSISQDGRIVAFSSCADNLMENDTNLGTDVFIRDRGLALGIDELGIGGSGPSPAAPDEICVTPDLCIPPLGVASSSDQEDRLVDGADLVELSLAYRPMTQDLYVVEELQHMPGLRLGGPSAAGVDSSHLLYGLRFGVGDNRFEVRASSLLGGTFELFECAQKHLCHKVADLRGGYGTTGERVVFSVPLNAIGLEEGGDLTDLEAFSALGSNPGGATRVLDSLKLK